MNPDQTDLIFNAPHQDKHKRPHWQNIALPYNKWPAIDQAIWERAQLASGPFDFDAHMARLAKPTITGRQKSYGALLNYQRTSGTLNAALHPGERITPDLMLTYVDYLRQRMRASSIHEEINRLVTSLTVLAPQKDWSWIRKLPNAPTRAEIARSKKPIDPPDPAEVISAALQQFDEADAMPPSLRRSTYARDGLLIAFAALFALRRKNLQEIERGTHLLEDGSSFRLTFTDTVKNHTSLLFDIPDWLMPRFQRYLLVHRPRLLGAHEDHCLVWVSLRGTPLSPISIGGIFADFGREKLTRHLNTHLFRHAMANTVVLRNPADTDLAAAALGHTTTRMVTEVYTKSAGSEFGKVWHKKLKARKRQLGLEN